MPTLTLVAFLAGLTGFSLALLWRPGQRRSRRRDPRPTHQIARDALEDAIATIDHAYHTVRAMDGDRLDGPYTWLLCKSADVLHHRLTDVIDLQRRELVREVASVTAPSQTAEAGR